MQPGQIVGGYELVSLIAQGGMGVIWKARHPSLERWVAIKHIRGDVAADDDIRKAFVQEVKNLSRLHSPHIVHIIDHGITEQGEPYMVTEFLEGEDLGQRLQREMSLSVETTLRIGIEILKALSEAHAIGMVHRDLKPGNIFLQRLAGETREAVKVLDFGVAKFLSDGLSTHLEPSMGAKGTARFMAPEQALQDPVTTAADIYSFGATLYRMLTGTYVFGGSAVEVLQQLLNHTPEPVRQRHPDAGCPEELEDLIMLCLSKAPSERPASADAVLSRMERMLTRQVRLNYGSLGPSGLLEGPESIDEGLPSWLESVSGIGELHESEDHHPRESPDASLKTEEVAAFGSDGFLNFQSDVGTEPVLERAVDLESVRPQASPVFDASKTVEEAQPAQMLAELKSDSLPTLASISRPPPSVEADEPSKDLERPAAVAYTASHTVQTEPVAGLRGWLFASPARWLTLMCVGIGIGIVVVSVGPSGTGETPMQTDVTESDGSDVDESSTRTADWIEAQTRRFEAEDREKAERKKLREQKKAKKRSQIPQRVQVKVTHGAADFIRVLDGQVICKRQVFCLLRVNQAVRVQRPGFKPRVLSKAELMSFRGTERTIRLKPR